MKEKTIVLYYSYTGHSAEKAKAKAQKEDAALCEIKDVKRPATIAAYSVGCFRAMRMKATSIQPLNVSLADYDRVILYGPVWASHPAPAVNAVLQQLPSGKGVEVFMVSASGNSGARDKVTELVRSKGCRMMRYEDVKA